MTSLLFLLFALGSGLALVWGLRRLLAGAEASLALLLTWPTTTRAAWLEEKLRS